MIKAFQKMTSFFLVLHFFFGSLLNTAFAADDKSLSTRKCGDFELISETLESYSPAESGFKVCRQDDGIADYRFKTKEAKTQIYVPESTFTLSKSMGEVVDRALLDLLRKKIQKKFDAKLSTMDFQNEKTFYEAFISMQKKILDDGKAPKHQVRKLMVLFPDLEKEILEEFPEYKPLVCRYEVWKHNQAILKKVAFALSVIELAALMAAVPIAGTVVLTANIDRAILLGQILIGGGIAGVIGGALQIENNIANWDKVTAAKNARMLVKFYNNVEKEIKRLQKDPVTNKDKIAELKKWLPTEPERNQLKKIKTLEAKQYIGLFMGLTKVGLGVTMIYGGEELFKMISNFESEAIPGDPSSGAIDPPWVD